MFVDTVTVPYAPITSWDHILISISWGDCLDLRKKSRWNHTFDKEDTKGTNLNEQEWTSLQKKA